MNVDGVVLLRVRQDEVQQKRLPAARRAQHQRVPHVTVVEIPVIRRSGARSRTRPGSPPPRCATRALAGARREQERQIRAVRVEQRQAAKVVGAVPGHRGEPSVQEVVALLEHGPVVRRERFHAGRRRSDRAGAVAVDEHDGQRTRAKDMPVDVQLGERLPQLAERSPPQSRR